MSHLRRIRIAYVLGAVGAALVAGAVIAIAGRDDAGGAQKSPPRVDIGGGSGPRACAERSVPLRTTRLLAETETASARAPVRVTATVTGLEGSISKATASDVVRQSATVTVRTRLTVRAAGRAGVCARSSSAAGARRRAAAAAEQRAVRQARRLLPRAVEREEAKVRPALAARARTEAKVVAAKRLRAALPAARAEVTRRASRAARERAGAP
jgi:hypothetical protein